MSKTSEYNRNYYLKNREKILAARRKKYMTDPQFAERQRKRSAKNMRRIRSIKSNGKKEKKARHPSAPRMFEMKIGAEFIKVPMYFIGALAAKLERKTQTLHMWERIGVLPEALFRDAAGRRLYTEDQVIFLVNAYKEVMKKSVGHRWLAELKGAFHNAWKKLPNGMKSNGSRNNKD